MFLLLLMIWVATAFHFSVIAYHFIQSGLSIERKFPCLLISSIFPIRATFLTERRLQNEARGKAKCLRTVSKLQNRLVKIIRTHVLSISCTNDIYLLSSSLCSSMRAYLNLCERLSQVYLNQLTLMLVLMTLKIFLFRNALSNSISKASDETALVCEYLESYSSMITLIPQKLVNMANQLLLEALEELNIGMVNVVKFMLTIVEYIIIFYVEVLFGTMTCLITAALTGTVDLALDSTELLISSVNLTIIGLADDVQLGLDGLSTILNEVISAYEKVESFFTGKKYNGTEYVDLINLTVSALKNIKIPSSVTESIEAIKTNVPTFSTNSTVEFIESGFDLIKTKVTVKLTQNLTIANFSSFPNLQEIQFCSSTTEFDKDYEKIGNIINRTANWVITALIVACCASIILFAISEYFKWNRQNNLAEEISATLDQPEETRKSRLLGIISIYQCQPSYLFRKCFNVSLIFIPYVFSPYANFILGLAMCSLITVGLQSLILRVLSSEFGKVNEYIVKSILSDFDSTFLAASKNWTSETNLFLGDQETQLNEELFGWIQSATNTVNGSVNSLMLDLNQGLSIFNGTVFYSPMRTIVYCVIGRKLEEIQEGLAWVHENAVLTIPQVSENLLSNELSSIIGSDNSNSTTQSYEAKLESALDRLIDLYKNQLKTELLIAICLLSVWFLQVIFGTILVLVRKNSYLGQRMEKLLHNSSAEAAENHEKKNYLQPNVEDISSPRQLTLDEKKLYGYPYVDPYEDFMTSGNAGPSSSVYSHGDTLQFTISSDDRSHTFKYYSNIKK